MIARIESPESSEVLWATFSPDGSRLVLVPNSIPAVRVWDLRLLRKRLAAMHLDWDAPAFSDDDPASPSAAPLPRLQVDRELPVGDIESLSEAPATLIKRQTAQLKNNPNDAE